jgi:uncharacterized protein YndB with AHSA1/START domain
MPAAMQGFVLHQPVNAPRDRLWSAFATSQGLAAWQADLVTGEVQQGSRLVMSWPALSVRIDVEVEELVEQERLVMRTGDLRMALDLADERVTLDVTGCTTEDEAQGSAAAWRVSLATMAHYVEHHADQQRHVSWAVRPAEASAGAAYMCFTDAELLGAWLGNTSGPIDKPGQRFSLELASGATMTGRVLALTPGRDLALSWHEQDHSVLALRTLPSPRKSGERLLVLAWSRWNATGAGRAIWSDFEAALGRLGRLLALHGDA